VDHCNILWIAFQPILDASTDFDQDSERRGRVPRKIEFHYHVSKRRVVIGNLRHIPDHILLVMLGIEKVGKRMEVMVWI